jgi:hypothetical protein
MMHRVGRAIFGPTMVILMMVSLASTANAGGVLINEALIDPSNRVGWLDSTHEYIELTNIGGKKVDLDGWVLQYGRRDGSGNFVLISQDTIENDPDHGGCGTVLKPSGYALLTDTDTSVYSGDWNIPACDGHHLRLKVDDNALGSGLSNSAARVLILQDPDGSVADTFDFSAPVLGVDDNINVGLERVHHSRGRTSVDILAPTFWAATQNWVDDDYSFNAFALVLPGTPSAKNQWTKGLANKLIVWANKADEDDWKTQCLIDRWSTFRDPDEGATTMVDGAPFTSPEDLYTVMVDAADQSGGLTTADQRNAAIFFLCTMEVVFPQWTAESGLP